MNIRGSRAKSRYKTRIGFTVIALLPAAFHFLRPELSFDPIALILALGITSAWLGILIRNVRVRWQSARLLELRESGLRALVDEFRRRHRTTFR